MSTYSAEFWVQTANRSDSDEGRMRGKIASAAVPCKEHHLLKFAGNQNVQRVLAVFGSALFLVLAPGTVAVLIPWWISHWHFEAPFPGYFCIRLIGGVVIAAASAVLLDSFGRFAL